MNILLFSLSEVISSSDGISKAFSTLANDLSTHGYNVTAIFTCLLYTSPSPRDTR